VPDDDGPDSGSQGQGDPATRPWISFAEDELGKRLVTLLFEALQLRTQMAWRKTGSRSDGADGQFVDWDDVPRTLEVKFARVTLSGRDRAYLRWSFGKVNLTRLADVTVYIGIPYPTNQNKDKDYINIGLGDLRVQSSMTIAELFPRLTVIMAPRTRQWGDGSNEAMVLPKTKSKSKDPMYRCVAADTNAVKANLRICLTRL